MNHDPIKKLARRLLMSTCLTLGATRAAHATTVYEPPDFSNDFNSPTLLPLGTSGVSGSVSTADFDDYPLSQGLTPGETLSFETTTSVVFNGFFYFMNSSANFIANATPTGTLIVPGNGLVMVRASYEGSSSVSYTATFVPEPSTVTGVGMGLAAAALAALRRKKQ